MSQPGCQLIPASHQGGRLGWWSVTCQEEVITADMKNVLSKSSAAWVIYFGRGKILARTFFVANRVNSLWCALYVVR